MHYNISIHRDVQKYLNALDSGTKSRLVEGLRQLKNDPLSRDVKKLKGTKGRQDLYRLRIGDYRAIFSIEDDNVYILEIMLRKGMAGLSASLSSNE
ncbi:mRNA interferase RelE/StbE [Methanohalophilus levihalophilus]|uniref:type II toxin-antitoxin system RelE family toxin n=1 Tax=Methanohalophilus levihalophilus TaxID=1431282 RepID=UPI001AE7FEA0|nr:type II toxin-antitoxin system RelE/ParE family toxin [Methanohalophilus levihalophilus]MBP2030056.1 mRNA interferase RelE/StbE [Methanohalophilus levihalophilus]